MPRFASRFASPVVGACASVALTACHNGPAAERSHAIPVAIADTTRFAPILEIDLAKFTRTRSGAFYRDVVAGTGTVVAVGRTLTVTYVVSLPNGSVVETQTTPLEFLLGPDVIRGWREALPGMRVGGSRTLVVPPGLGYGAKPHDAIPSQSILIFEIQLVNVR